MFDFSRRINRSTYLVGFVLAFLSALVIGNLLILIADYFSDKNSWNVISIISGVLILVLVLVIIIYLLCITRQRANDISGKHPLLAFIFITLFYFFVIGWVIPGLVPGEKHKNRYGPVPKKGLAIR